MDGNFLRLAFAWIAAGFSGLGAYTLLSGAMDHAACKAPSALQDAFGICIAAFMFVTSLGLFCRALDVIAHEESDRRIRDFLRYRR
jgi:hypothetical protein